MDTELMKVLIRSEVEEQVEVVNQRVSDLLQQIEEKELADLEDDPRWAEIHEKVDQNTKYIKELTQKFLKMQTKLEITRLMYQKMLNKQKTVS